MKILFNKKGNCMLLVFIYILFSCKKEDVDSLNNSPINSVSKNLLKDYTTKVVEVKSKTGRIWMDRNLGATQSATSLTDEKSYGDLYQWGRGTDGHQLRTSGINTQPNSKEVPGHGDFIIPEIGLFEQWIQEKFNHLWQGEKGVNNPCPKGFRIPSRDEWVKEKMTWDITNGKEYTDAVGAFNSVLKLPLTGERRYDVNKKSVEIALTGDVGIYWTSDVFVTSGDNRVLPNSYFLRISEFISGKGSPYNAFINFGRIASGYTCRCIKD